jgi:hypothetical protein
MAGGKFCWGCLLAALISFGASAAPVEYPKRWVDSYTVDLGPLFNWWGKREGPRPLSSWVHVTGSIVGTNSAGWIIEADLDGAADRKAVKNASGPPPGAQRIILMSPPVDDLVEFERLSARLDTLSRQRMELAAEENEAKNREQAMAEQQRSARRNGSRARVLTLEVRQLKEAENRAYQGQRPLDQEIQELKKKLASYPHSDHYLVDCFALDRHWEYERLRVYDHGRIVK